MKVILGSLNLAYCLNVYICLYFLVGNGIDYMNLALQDGGVALTVKLGIGKLDTQIKTDSVRFDDNQWHHVLVSRESSKVKETFLFSLLFFLLRRPLFYFSFASSRIC